MIKPIPNNPKYLISDSGEVYNAKTNRLLKQHNHKGYLRVGLVDNGIQKHYLVHRLVAQTFIPNPENLDTVNHINHIRTDNRAENLEWMSRKDNSRDGREKLTSEQVREIRDTINDMVKKYDISIATICSILNHNTYKESEE